MLVDKCGRRWSKGLSYLQNIRYHEFVERSAPFVELLEGHCIFEFRSIDSGGKEGIHP